MNHYPHHIGDYLKDTAHLTLLEHGCYRRLMDVYYTREGPLPADLAGVCRLVSAQTKDERQAVETILREFFELLPDGWHQTRCDIEILKCKEKGSIASASAKSRWTHTERNANAMRTDMRTHSERSAEAMLTNNQEPITNNQKPKSKAKPSADFAAPPWLDPDAWGAWLQVRAKKRAAATPYALGLAVKSLEELRDQGHDPKACLDQSIAKGWLTFYPPKSGSFQYVQTDRDADRKRTIDELTGRLTAAVG